MGLLDKRNQDMKITIKKPNGASVTYHSPEGSQVEMMGLLGGMVEGPDMGPTADNVTARLTPGEFVVNRPAAMKYGGLLRDINNEGKEMLHAAGYAGGGMIPGYQEGGTVKPADAPEWAIAEGTVGWFGQRRFQHSDGSWRTAEGRKIASYQWDDIDNVVRYAGAGDPQRVTRNRFGIVQEPIAGAAENVIGLGREWQPEVTVPAGADKYQDDPFYDLVSDDRFTGYRTYRLNQEKLAEANQQWPAAGREAEQFGERQKWMDRQQARHDRQQAGAQWQAGRITEQYPTRGESIADYQAGQAEAQRQGGLLREQFPTRGASIEQAAADQRAREAEYAAAQASGGQLREQAEAAARADALARATATAEGETQARFKYQEGESYNAPSKEAAQQWVDAGIVAAGAMFTLPNGITGRAV